MSDIQLNETQYIKVKEQVDKELLIEHSFPVKPGNYLTKENPHGGLSAYLVTDVYYEGEKNQLKLEVKSVAGYYVGREKTLSIREAKRKYAFTKDNPLEFQDEAITEYLGGGFSTPYDQDIEEYSEETSLIRVDQAQVKAHQEKLIKRSNYLRAKFGVVEAVLNKKRSEFLEIKRELQDKISRLREVIHTLELYLGIGEDIKTIQEGQPAPADSPLTMRQGIVYMDEEVGDPSNQGLDFQNVGDFYEWLCQYNEYHDCYNYEITIPEEKSVVPVQIRRKNKDYSENPFVNIHLNQHNKQTCFLIRNGENLFAVWADIRVHPRLFPGEEELLELQEKIIEDDFEWSSSKKKLKKKLHKKSFRYKLQILVLQGLMHREDIFGQRFSRVNLLDLDIEKSNLVTFIYDDTNPQLDNPYTRYQQWKEEINSKISEGSRVFLYEATCPYYRSDDQGYWRRHRKPFYNSNSSIADPNNGVYTVEKRSLPNLFRGDSEEVGLFIKYLPDEKVYTRYETKERKQRISFRIQKDDSFVINYDEIFQEDLDRLEAMIYNRANRKDYLDMVPMLMNLIKTKQEELDREKEFWQLMANDLLNEENITVTNETLIEEYIKPATRWWKLKNKWKRGLQTDDAKAFRMIKKRVLKTFPAKDTK